MGITRRAFLKKSSLAGGISLLMGGRLLAEPGQPEPRLRFIALADTHWGGYEDWRPERKDNTIQAVNAACGAVKTDFIVLNGDIIHDDPKVQIPKFLPNMKRFDVPVYMTHGNHDIMTDEQFKRFTGHPKDHHFALDNCGVILLNTYKCPPKVEYGDHRSGHIPPDLEFLEDALHTYKDAFHIFVFAHRCPTDRPQSEEWLELMRGRGNVSSFYGHAHSRWETLTIEGKVHHFSGHNTDTTGRWQNWHTYRVVEVSDAGEIRSSVRDYTNDMQRESVIIKPA